MDTYKAPSTHIGREFLKTESFFSSLGYVHSASDSFCAVMKIIPDRASVHTQERLWWRDFCNGLHKFTQRSIPYRFGLGLSTVSKLVSFFYWVGVDAIYTIIISLPSN